MLLSFILDTTLTALDVAIQEPAPIPADSAQEAAAYAFQTKKIVVQSAVIGILSSFIASAVFLNLLFFLRPRFIISKHVSVTKIDGVVQYVIKVVNRSFHKMYDVNVELVIMNPVNSPGGRNLILEPVKLVRDKIWYISQRPYLEKNSQFGSHAILFRTKEDLGAKWSKDGSMLHFKVIAKHGLSGFTKVQSMRYHDKDATIRAGKFRFGKSLEIQ